MDDLSTRVVLVTALAVVAVPTVAFWVGSLSGEPTPTLALAAVGVPLLLVLGFGLVLGRRVASSADDPDVVDGVVAESLGESQEELEEFFE